MARHAILAATLAAGVGGGAAADNCRLALALAMDVSSSVDAAEDALQRGGLASALLAPEVQTAFFAAPQPVALAVYEWSGRFNQALLVDWTLITDRATLLGVAERVGRSTRSTNESPTALGHALAYGSQLFRRGPDCLFRTIDMAGDGENNEGYRPASAYKAFPFEGVVVNGLVINGGDFEAETGLIQFYQDEVLFGPGAFLEIAQGFEDYERAMRRKLERELAGPVIGMTPSRAGTDGG
ncbi:Protein of unknown function [Cribrihabitans marinus]|uniref:VWFA domain-containing protein n=1 Tax=Cribrihabitans marinus TaxID=1227549 RepID=A0A1H6T580_9RHOB|nr:DUF1194 domain-containing protein [Cribrihabitans marinus]GGH22434.1 hypothetical protein GCM10010973_07720 [Cribrihabitans marinus]SEI74416.1 Protein of unknown function [Cribrihabitans marinus]